MINKILSYFTKKQMPHEVMQAIANTLCTSDERLIKKALESHLDLLGGSGSYFRGIKSKEALVEHLKSLDWDPTPRLDIDNSRIYTAKDTRGVIGIADLYTLPLDLEVRFEEGFLRKSVVVVAPPQDKIKRATTTSIVIRNYHGLSFPVAVSCYPGSPARLTPRGKSPQHLIGTTGTVADALAYGYINARIMH